MPRVPQPPRKEDQRFDDWTYQFWKYFNNMKTLTNAVNDAAAASAGVAVGEMYRNGSVLMVRVT